MLCMQGQAVVNGIAIGKAVVMGATALEIPHYHIDPAEVEAECERFKAAVTATGLQLQTLIQSLPDDAPRELGPLLEVHYLLLNDAMLTDQVTALIRSQRYNAEWALTAQGQLLGEQFSAMEDAYLRERGADVRQVIERVLRVLTGTPSLLPDVVSNSAEDALIVVARDIAPGDMLRLREHQFRAFLTDLGGTTSHTAIVVRSMNVPAVVGLGAFRSVVRDWDIIIIDGFTGWVMVNPSATVLQEYRTRQKQAEQQRQELALLKDQPAVTLDGIRVKLQANIELPDEAEDALAVGAEGIGLFRTEFLFMGRANPPDEEAQYQAYAHVVKVMQGRPVTIRTLDIGADKILDDDATVATNPALGLRAVRYCMARPEQFQTQLRALLRASDHGHVRILVPMITQMQEVIAVREALEQARADVMKAAPALDIKVSLGAMVETPAIAIAIEPFARAFDFLSIGTNDLIQYTLAVDRTDPEVTDLYDPLHPAVLRLISHVINVGHRFNKPVSMCGEMAGNTRVTRLLLALGLTSFSMHPQQLLDVKQRILKTNSATLRMTLAPALNRGEHIDADQLAG